MIPLLFLAFALGAVALTYEISPEARSWIDEHARALRGALAAHLAADDHLAAARTAADPSVAVAHAHAASTANRVAAQETVRAAGTAGTPGQHAVAAQSAAAVADREKKIATALAQLGEQVHTWIDDHTRVFLGALAAHHAADAHLEAAGAVPDPTAAAQHLHEASTANRVAAQETARGAEAAQTEQQRAVAARSAAAVLEREQKIATALAQLGVGQCAVRSYAGVTPQIRDALLSRLHAEGMLVTGDDPWDIDTRSYDVKLRAVWDPRTQGLKLVVTSGAGGYLGLVTCSAIWAKIDPIVKEIVGT